MDSFRYKDGTLYAEGVPVRKIVEDVGTPAYVYSRETFLDHYTKIDKAFAEVPHLICYSVKANSCLAVLAVLNEAGAGFDVVSGGELVRVQKIGGDMKQVVFAGVGKTDEELAQALRAGILMFNVESEAELENIDRIAGQLKADGEIREPARVALRVNPDVDPKTHAYITTGKKENKFGVDLERASRILQEAGRFPNVRVAGIHAHIGSQITEVKPYQESLGKVVKFIQEHRRKEVPIQYLNSGGGFGIWYQDRKAQPASKYAEVIVPLVKDSGCTLVLEPGRFISGNSGIMLTKIVYVKESAGKRFLIVDAGMNDLVRPSLYGAFHEIWPLDAEALPPTRGGGPAEGAAYTQSDIVGPICESGDFLAKDRALPKGLGRGDVLAVYSAGAYGYVMAGNYNTRPFLPEVMVRGDKHYVVNRRQTVEELLEREKVPQELL
ncbi:MAG: diaminopimelate decarboxylase [Planctomycetota bacterium]|nr:diaminopimelate decarboxylase [Planctomycetota bacterium]